MTDYEDLGNLAVFSVMTETKLREGRYKTVEALSTFYNAYMELRFETLNPKNKIFHEGSLRAYDCTLELITSVMDSLNGLDGNEKSKRSLKETLQKDYEKVKEMKEKFRKRLEAYM